MNNDHWKGIWVLCQSHQWNLRPRSPVFWHKHWGLKSEFGCCSRTKTTRQATYNHKDGFEYSRFRLLSFSILSIPGERHSMVSLTHLLAGCLSKKNFEMLSLEHGKWVAGKLMGWEARAGLGSEWLGSLMGWEARAALGSEWLGSQWGESMEWALQPLLCRRGSLFQGETEALV